MDLPLGIRNNNPTNIRYVESIKWQGQTGENGGFCVFDTMRNGCRAGAKNILAKFHRGNDTIRGIIHELSPPGENPTEAYVKFIDSAMGAVGADTKLEPTEEIVFALLKHICRFENGAYTVSDSVLWSGVNDAFERV